MTCPDCEQARAERDAANRQLARLCRQVSDLERLVEELARNRPGGSDDAA